ncbi:Rep family protein, partial [Adlercreutzia sp. DFI.6.23]|uniref:Rep family protein n=1 Tax=Adlercreutzia sp. DFI.6.23 TaxID=2963705 RepID=UPI00352629A8|nr:hypothetical protein [Adlercreutzia sp. DFI.6.23]
ATLPVDFRLRQLRRLQAYLLAHEQEALDALHADLGKSAFESYATELGLVYDEIRLYLRKLRQWARPRRVPTPWREIINGWLVDCLVSPLHDSDVNEDGTPKKP